MKNLYKEILIIIIYTILIPFIIVSLVFIGIIYVFSILFKKKNYIYKLIINRKQKELIPICIIIFCIILGFFIVTLSSFGNYKLKKENEDNISNYFISKDSNEEDFKNSESSNINIVKEDKTKRIKDNYMAIIEIEKINLLQGIIKSNSYYAAIDRNVSYLSDSDLPNIKGGNFVLAAHSGNANIAYFDDIDKLEKKEIIIIYYNDIKYTYNVYLNYVVSQNQIEVLNREGDKTTITLITCQKENNKKRVIIKGILIAEEPYI